MAIRRKINSHIAANMRYNDGYREEDFDDDDDEIS